MVSGFLVEELSIWDCRDFGFSTRTATPALIASCFARTRCISSFKERPWLSNSSFLNRASMHKSLKEEILALPTWFAIHEVGSFTLKKKGQILHNIKCGATEMSA